MVKDMYKVGMLCKHFKGASLIEKNIYKIIEIGVRGNNVPDYYIYSGDGILEEASDLVLYQNIFQDNAFFAREYADFSKILPNDKQKDSNQTFRVEPLTDEEISIISSDDFIKEKKSYM